MAKRRRKNAKSELNKLSEFLLTANKVVRDVNAIKKGTISGRIERRILGKLASRGLGSEFLKFFQK